MSHTTPIKPDPGINQPITLRKARNQPIIFRFLDSEGAAYNLADTFRLDVYASDRDTTPLFSLTEAVDGGLTKTDNELLADFDDENTDIDFHKVYYELKNTTTVKNWMQGKITLITGEATEDTDTEVESTINVDDQVIEVTMTLLAQTGAITLSTFAAALTFDRDKEFETVLGGTTTFTLAASGHYNGVGIIVRINEPVAVNFPAGFEAVNGSDSISTTDMNIIIFRYYEDYDGAGNDKVLYVIKNQTAV